MTEPEAARFWDFVAERDRVWRRREVERLPEPWTDDPVLREYHFTNVHRKKDPGTRWIVDLCARRGVVDLPDAMFAVYCYRSLNRVSTFEAFGFPSRDATCVAAWVETLAAAHDAGRALGSRRHLTYFARLRKRLPGLVDSANDAASELAGARDGVEAVRVLMGLRLDVGVFLGTQVVADLALLGPPQLGFGADTRVPVSGGSRFGLGLVAGTLTEAERERRAYAERTAAGRRQRELSTKRGEGELLDRLLADQPTTLSEPLTMIDLETCLCEYARYARLADGDTTRRAHMLRDPS